MLFSIFDQVCLAKIGAGIAVVFVVLLVMFCCVCWTFCVVFERTPPRSPEMNASHIEGMAHRRLGKHHRPWRRWGGQDTAWWRSVDSKPRRENDRFIPLFDTGGEEERRGSTSIIASSINRRWKAHQELPNIVEASSRTLIVIWSFSAGRE